jgi:trans-aconitate 2-methyltransferase
MSNAAWNPDQYLQFRNERTQPSVDLIGRIEISDPASIVDLGCGPGNSTQLLRQRWPQAKVAGLDNSSEMLERARLECPEIEWILGDVTTFSRERSWDIVFSSAMLQWVKDHNTVVPSLFQTVNKGGVLAVQVPANAESPLHRSYQAVAAREPWKSRTGGYRDLLNYRPAAHYYDLLATRSARIELWETTYYHILKSHQDLIAWYRSTAMRPLLSRLADPKQREQFEQEVLEGCAAQYEARPDGQVLYPFKRLFFVAYHP